MTTFTIDAENNITTHASRDEAEAVSGADRFSTAKELAELGANWSGERLVDIWNSLPGVTPVKKFTDRKTAFTRIWKAIEHLGEPASEQTASAAPRAGRAAPKKAKPERKTRPTKKPLKRGKKAGLARDGSKTAKILDLLKRPGGVTAKELMKATTWKAHSLRGFLSGTVGKKMGLTVISAKGEDGERSYSVKA